METARLEAYCDDSASNIGDQRLFLAGYLSSSEQWAQFSAAWRAELQASPAISYLKMSEAWSMRGQFAGWSRPDRDSKIERLVQIIQESKLLSFEISLSQKTYNEIVKPYAPRGLGNAHFCCIFGIVSNVSRYLSAQHFGVTVDFYFDNQNGVQEDFDLFFDYMKKDIPHSARKLIRKKPEFLNDQIALPLQACDMLAWHIRREHESGLPKFCLADKLSNPKLHISSNISDDILSNWGQAFEKTPNVKLIQSKSQWQKMRKTTRDALSAGYIPPYGTHWRNFIYIARQKVRGFLRR